MRTLLKFSMAVEAANKAIQDGRLQDMIESLNSELRPEACYFYAENGKRTGLLVFEMKDPSDIPAIAEPLFELLGAEVTLSPVMDMADVKNGLEKAARGRMRVPVGAG